MFLSTCRAMLLCCHRAPSPRLHWGAFRPALSAGTLTPRPSSSEPELLQSEWLDPELGLEQCSAVSSSVMLGLCGVILSTSADWICCWLRRLIVPLLFTGTHLWSSSCSHMLSWVLPCLKPWDCSVWWLLSLFCLLCKTAVTTLALPMWWIHILLWLPKLFRIGVMKMYIFRSFRHCQTETCIVQNVRNYVIKIHVFDYLILAVTLCLGYVANPIECSWLSWMSSCGKLLQKLSGSLVLKTHAGFGINLTELSAWLQFTGTVKYSKCSLL